MARRKKSKSLFSAFDKGTGKKSLFNAFDKGKGKKSLFNVFDKGKGKKSLFNVFDKGKGKKSLFNAFDSKGKKGKKANNIFGGSSGGGLSGFFGSLFNPTSYNSYNREIGGHDMKDSRQSALYYILKFETEEEAQRALNNMRENTYQTQGGRASTYTAERNEWVLDQWRKYKSSPLFMEQENRLKMAESVTDAESILSTLGRVPKGVLYYLQDLAYKK